MALVDVTDVTGRMWNLWEGRAFDRLGPQGW